MMICFLGKSERERETVSLFLFLSSPIITPITIITSYHHSIYIYQQLRSTRMNVKRSFAECMPLCPRQPHVTTAVKICIVGSSTSFKKTQFGIFLSDFSSSILNHESFAKVIGNDGVWGCCLHKKISCKALSEPVSRSSFVL